MSQPAADATTRFSSRVDDYIRYRPSYPVGVLNYLMEREGLLRGDRVADIGAGTGIFTRLLLDAGCVVDAVEPNADMRAAAVGLLGGYAGFRAVDATAEQTKLPAASVEWVMAAQAFHWFDVPAARREFGRILRDPRPDQPAQVVLLWNNRREDTPFLADYERFCCEFGTDYLRIKHQNAEGDGRVAELLAAGARLSKFAHGQIVDADGLRGRTLSCSYIPGRGAPGHAEMLTALEALFARHARDGRVEIVYDTHVYAGRLA